MCRRGTFILQTFFSFLSTTRVAGGKRKQVEDEVHAFPVAPIHLGNRIGLVFAASFCSPPPTTSPFPPPSHFFHGGAKVTVRTRGADFFSETLNCWRCCVPCSAGPTPSLSVKTHFLSLLLHLTTISSREGFVFVFVFVFQKHMFPYFLQHSEV